MKKFNKLAMLVASATLVMSAGSAFAAEASSGQDNWKSGNGALVWRTGNGSLCWRDNFWTPATANVDCDGAITVEEPKAQPVPSKEPGYEKVSYSADTLFDFDKAVLKPAGKEVLDELVRRIGGMDLEVVVAIGHTDSTGPAAYNEKLSLRRAEAVKAYMVNCGVPADRIYVEGKGETEPVADNKTRQGRAQNRRVEIEVVGNVEVRR